MQSFLIRSRRHLTLFCVVSLLAFTSLLSVASASEDGTSEQVQAAVDSSLSPEGQRILIATLALAGLLIALERVCCWRLGVCLRRDGAPSPERRSMRPAVPSELDPTSPMMLDR